MHKLDVIRTTHTDCGVVPLGDFNWLDIFELLIHQNLKHIVGPNLTNLNELYNEPTVIAPLGTSDHNIVKWTPSSGGSVRLYVKNS